MKKFLLPFASLLLFGKAEAQWASQTAPNPSNNLYSVFVLSPSNVAAAGVSGVIRTLNGGVTWTQPVSIGGANFYELHTKHPSKWYSLSQNSSWFIKMSTGSTTLQGGKPDSILSLHFPTQACAIAVGTAGKIEATCDTGATWQLRNSGSSLNLNAVWFADSDTGCVVGNSGTIRRTTDAGATWSVVTSGTALGLNGIHFPTPTVGYIVGNAGYFAKSTDAGKTWTAVPTGTNTNLNGVFFIDQDTGYVVGGAGLIMKTINGGTSWAQQNSTTAQILNSVHFASPVDGWVVGNAGTILHYTGIFTGVPAPAPPAVPSNIFPVPAKDRITIQSLPGVSLRVLNALSQVLNEIQMPGEEIQLDISSYAKGVYFIELKNGENTAMKKFIKE